MVTEMAQLAPLLQWLEQRHHEVMASEQAALDFLKTDDIKSYKIKMREKAGLLAAMSRDSSHLLASLPDSCRNDIGRAIDSFSSSASTALKLDSVFYMSALLYRDDHKPGEPDNLLVFINKLKNNGC